MNPSLRVDPDLLARADAAKGFMPPDEGEALTAAALVAFGLGRGPVLEVGTYCGKSALYLGAAARAANVNVNGVDHVVFTVDHHHGSEENQAGWEHHDDSVVDPRTGRMDTLPFFRATIEDAGLEDVVVAIVGASATVARWWSTPLSMLFIDGGHGDDVADSDRRLWTPHVAPSGLLAIHDVFPDPADGGRPPYERIYLPALVSGRFTERHDLSRGSLRVLQAD